MVGEAGARIVVQVQEDRLRKMVDARVAQALSDAGAGVGSVAQEVLFMLPAEFVRGYERLFHEALVMGGSGGRLDGEGGAEDAKRELGRSAGKASGKTAGGWPLKSEDTGGEMRGAKKAKKGKGPAGVFTVRNEKALAEKARVDKALRKLARGLRDWDGAGDGAGLGALRVRCEGKKGTKDEGKGCGKYTEEGWKYCARCGVLLG